MRWDLPRSQGRFSAAKSPDNLFYIIDQDNTELSILRDGKELYTANLRIMVGGTGGFPFFYVPFLPSSRTIRDGSVEHTLYLYLLPVGQIFRVVFREYQNPFDLEGTNVVDLAESRQITDSAGPITIDSMSRLREGPLPDHTHAHIATIRGAYGQEPMLVVLSMRRRAEGLVRYDVHTWRPSYGWEAHFTISDVLQSITPTRNGCLVQSEDPGGLEFLSMAGEGHVQHAWLPIQGTPMPATAQNYIHDEFLNMEHAYLSDRFYCLVGGIPKRRAASLGPFRCGAREIGLVPSDKGNFTILGLVVEHPLYISAKPFVLVCPPKDRPTKRDLLVLRLTSVTSGTLLVNHSPLFLYEKTAIKNLKTYHKLQRYLVRNRGFVGGGRDSVELPIVLSRTLRGKLQELSGVEPGARAKLYLCMDKKEVGVTIASEGKPILAKVLPREIWVDTFVRRRGNPSNEVYKQLIEIVQGASIDPRQLK